MSLTKVNPSVRWESVDVSGNVNFADNRPRGLWIGGAGDIVLNDGISDTTFVGVNAGQFLPISPVLIKAAGTTVSSVVALW